MELRLAVRTYLDRHNVSAYRLVQETRGRLAERTVYALARGEAKRVDLETLATVIESLEKLTGEPVGIADVLEVVREAKPPSAPPQPGPPNRGELERLLGEAVRTAKVTPGSGRRLEHREPFAVGDASPTVAEMLAEDRA